MMLKNLLAISAFSALTAAATAQVNFTNVLDVVTADLGASCFASDYEPNTDQFLVSAGGTTVNIFNGTTGADTGNTMDLTVPAPSGLGIFGIAAADDGRIFLFEDGSGNWYLYNSVTDTSPVVAVASAAFARFGHVEGSGTNTVLVATGGGTDGPANIYTTTDGTNYTLADAAPVAAKSGLAVNSTITTTWAVGDTGTNNCRKFNGTIGGTWTEDTTTWPATTPVDGAGPLVFDNANNVVFGLLMGGGPGTLEAVDADDATSLGSDTITNVPNTITGYHGDYLESTAGSGTLWTVARGATSSTAVMHKWTFTTGSPSEVEDWSAY